MEDGLSNLSAFSETGCYYKALQTFSLKVQSSTSEGPDFRVTKMTRIRFFSIHQLKEVQISILPYCTYAYPTITNLL